MTVDVATDLVRNSAARIWVLEPARLVLRAHRGLAAVRSPASPAPAPSK